MEAPRRTDSRFDLFGSLISGFSNRRDRELIHALSVGKSLNGGAAHGISGHGTGAALRGRPSPLWRPGYSWFMGILRWFERLLSKSAQPSAPARSTFGATDDRERAERAAANEFEFEVEKGKSRPNGF